MLFHIKNPQTKRPHNYPVNPGYQWELTSTALVIDSWIAIHFSWKPVFMVNKSISARYSLVTIISCSMVTSK
jgi:hypothetical protein